MGAEGEREFRLSPLAEADLDDIWSYTVETWSWEQAGIYHAALLKAFEDLAEGEVAGRNTDIRKAYLKYAVGSHFVYYRRIASGVEIIRILHKRMDVGLHLR